VPNLEQLLSRMANLENHHYESDSESDFDGLNI
jgi:hypothetical protein